MRQMAAELEDFHSSVRALQVRQFTLVRLFTLARLFTPLRQLTPRALSARLRRRRPARPSTPSSAGCWHGCRRRRGLVPCPVEPLRPW